MPLPHGFYDQLVTDTVARAISDSAPAAADLAPLNVDEAVDRLTDELSTELRRLLSAVDLADAVDTSETGRLQTQLALVNGLFAELRQRFGRPDDDLPHVVQPAHRLRAMYSGVGDPPVHPETGLAAPWLFTAGRASPALVTELRRESASCDQLDILVSFITVSGVRKLMDVLRAATAADAAGRGRTRIRVLTTTYMGATEVRALEELAGLNGCEVRVSLDGRRTRLHAKAWIFRRKTGFGSAYVGSANLSGAALMGGLEWTVKFTEKGQADLFQRAQAHFDTLWADDEFTLFRPGDEASRAAVVAALRRESGRDQEGPAVFFDIQPRPFQREMLDDLERERRQGRRHNLIVSATGTGKTVVAALDYRSIAAQVGHRPRLLFVAHRAQILRQALRTYREVLRDHSFGEMLSGGLVPERYDHLFATIDSVMSQELLERFGPEYWHTVVIDECHRLAGARFTRLASTVRPKYLLGLTATPERGDGVPIQPFFDTRPDRTPAVELRLWRALDLQLLAPFEYFACDDDTDLADVAWDTPAERAALDLRLARNATRARMVIDEWTRLSGDPIRSKALVFCVSVRHAEFMAEQLNAAGLPAMVVTGDTPRRDQLRAPHLLAEGKVCALVTVDLYNEGVDIPEVDTLILLRPTQSPVLFQQQIGRGLRLHERKESCLVLDFVGQHRTEFRFDRLLSAITGLSRRKLVEGVESGFTDLAPGCHIHLQRRTRDQVLRNLRHLTNHGWSRLVSEVQTFAALGGRDSVTLGKFMTEQRVSLEEIYRSSGRSGWTALKRDAGFLPGNGSPEEDQLSRRFSGLLHIDDPEYIDSIRRFAGESPATELSSPGDDVRFQMLTYQLLLERSAGSPLVVRERLGRAPACRTELMELADVLTARSRRDRSVLPGAEDVPLVLNGAYHVREILTAFGYLTADRYAPFQAGVLPLRDRTTELLLVTLDKSTGYHSRIAYRDYAISPKRFHWQTQNSAGPDTTAGRRYLESGTNGWSFQLFVRMRNEDPYRACGPVFVENAEEDISGDRPMNVNWTLRVPLPPELFARFSVIRG